MKRMVITSAVLFAMSLPIAGGKSPRIRNLLAPYKAWR